MTLTKMFQLMLGTVGLRFGGAAIGLLTQLALTRVLAPNEVGVVFLTMSTCCRDGFDRFTDPEVVRMPQVNRELPNLAL